MEGTIVGSQFKSEFGTVSGTDPTTDPLDQHGLTNDYPGITTVTGAGITTLEAAVNTATIDTSYFFDPIKTLLVDLNWNGIQTVPFLLVDPSAKFVLSAGGGAPTTAGVGAGDLGSINGGLSGDPFAGTAVASGPDFQIQADGNTAFGVVPEPASLLVWAGIGLIGLGCMRARRRR